MQTIERRPERLARILSWNASPDAARFKLTRLGTVTVSTVTGRQWNGARPLWAKNDSAWPFLFWALSDAGPSAVTVSHADGLRVSGPGPGNLSPRLRRQTHNPSAAQAQLSLAKAVGYPSSG